MYEKLIQRLREAGETLDAIADFVVVPNLGMLANLMYEAADAIEGLSSLVDYYGGETGIKNLHEYADKYWEIVKNEKVGEQYNKAYAEEYCNAHYFL